MSLQVLEYLHVVLGMDWISSNRAAAVVTPKVLVVVDAPVGDQERSLIARMMVAIHVTDFEVTTLWRPGPGAAIHFGEDHSACKGVMGTVGEHEGRRWIRSVPLQTLLEGADVASQKKIAWAHLQWLVQ
jgi:hypothetical protein